MDRAAARYLARRCQLVFGAWSSHVSQAVHARDSVGAVISGRRRWRRLRRVLSAWRADCHLSKRLVAHQESRRRYRWLGRCWAGWVRWTRALAAEREVALLELHLAEERRRMKAAAEWACARLKSTVFLNWLQVSVDAKEQQKAQVRWRPRRF